jgi:hypothetical protein
MATCRAVVPQPPPAEYVLTLSADEARALYAHLNCGPWPKDSNLFGPINRIVLALYDAGVRL